MIKHQPTRIPFHGGINKVVERASLNGYSEKNNFRDRHPGFISRKGQSRLHTTTDSAQEIYSLFQQKDKAGNYNFYAQRADGAVHKATNSPPTPTTGNFGAASLAALASTKPASWSILDDYLLYSDGKRMHQVYPGTGQRISEFHVYKGSAAIPVIPEIGEDYTEDVTDSDTSRVAVLSSLNTLAAYNCFYVCTEVPANALTLIMVLLNTTASVLAGQYWKSDGSWASLTTGWSDGTSETGGLTLGKSGTVSWTHPTDEIPHYQFGRTGYWYRFNVSVQLYSSVTVAQVTYTGAWNPIVNVWDGVLTSAIESQVYRAANLRYMIYGSTSINISDLFNNASDYVYFSPLNSLCGFYVDVGSTPNIIKATVTGSSDISFIDGGINDDYITWQSARFDDEGFEEGQTIVITNTTSNNITVKAKSVSANRIYVETGLLTAETNKSATLTFDNTATNTMTLEVWTGAGWTAVSNLNDGTTVTSKSGFVTFARTTTAQKSQFNGSGYYAYWYRFKYSKVTSRNAIIVITCMPYFDIADLGNGFCSTSWKGRPIVSYDKYGQFIHIGTSNRVNCFNGNDYAVLEVGDDGRSNKVLAMTQFYQDLLVFQEETGIKGGCITLIQGYSPETFGNLVISNRIGIINSKSYAVVDGVPTPNNPKASHAKMVYFVSKYGIFYTDGMNVVSIGENIKNFFDPTNTADCIRAGYEDKHWLKYDSTYNCLRIGLCTGASATVANTWLVYDIADGSWGTDTLGQALTCAAEIEAGSGNVSVLQVGGGSDGFIYLLNTGLNDVGATTVAVNAYCVIEVDGGGLKQDIKTMQLRCKAQAAGDITQSVAYNGNSSYGDSNTLSMLAVTANDTYRYNDFPVNRRLEDHVSLKFTHNTVSEEVLLLDIALLDAEGKNVFKT